MTRPTDRMPAIHPGEILLEEFLVPIEISVNALALALNVPASSIHEIIKEQRSITADTAERLVRYFGGDAQSWMVLQATYDLNTYQTREYSLRTNVGRVSVKVVDDISRQDKRVDK